MNRRNFLTFATKPATTARAAQRDVSRHGTSARRNANLTDQQLASRFLQQATFGPTLAEINHVTNIGFEAWIDEQFAAPQTDIQAYMLNVIEPLYQVEETLLLHVHPFRWAWWQAVMTGADILRQRVAMALSEIFVISTRTDALVDWSIAVGYFYDLLLKGAFGNYRDLLYDVSVSPSMGYYLSHAGNRKTDLATNRFPDENYAREVMQLFSIGLFELNNDGTRKKDGSGNDIPTYDNGVIKEFAKIFTGMTFEVDGPNGPDIVNEDDFVHTELTWENGNYPMKMYEAFHEPGTKTLLNGFVVPAGQTGLQDISDAVDNLFNHANVGPFIGRLLIQRLVTSNPSPAYINRVANAFNDNGSGVRGDMQAVVKAILLDDEARNPTYISDPTHGMLREPFVRYAQLCRSLESKNENGENRYYFFSEIPEFALAQYPFASPSVFNFFSPDFKPLGALEQAGLNAPEFQITTSVSVIKTLNFWEESVLEFVLETPKGIEDGDALPTDRMPNLSNVVIDYALFDDMTIDEVIGRLDLLLTYGTLSTPMRNIIRTALVSYHDSEGEWQGVLELAVYLFMASPEYAILK